MIVLTPLTAACLARSVSAIVTHSLDHSSKHALNLGISDKNIVVVQYLMPQPITAAYTSWTSDKHPVSTYVGKHTTNIYSEVSLKSVQILKKLRGMMMT